MNHIISHSALPLSSQTPTTELTTAPTTIATDPVLTDKPIVYSHDIDPFNRSSLSFQLNENLTISKPDANAIASMPIVKLHKVLPLAKPSTNHRQQRLNVFRPLFVYRQEQAEKNREKRKPYNPDRFRPNAYYPHHPYPYPNHAYPYPPYSPSYYNQYASGYLDYYDQHAYKNYNDISNDLSGARDPYDYWYR